MITAKDLRTLRREDWMELVRRGFPIEPTALDNTAYRGTSLGLPEWMERATWKTFMKVFYRDPETLRLRGWNVRVEQRGLDAPSVPKLRRDGQPESFGHYEVTSLEGVSMPEPVRDGLLLDYGRGGNARLDPVGRVRDPIVSLQRNNAHLLLGWTYMDLGFTRVGTPSFFILEHEGPLTHRANPPRRPA